MGEGFVETVQRLVVIHGIHQVVDADRIVDHHEREIVISLAGRPGDLVEIIVHGIRLEQHPESLPDVGARVNGRLGFAPQERLTVNRPRHVDKLPVALLRGIGCPGHVQLFEVIHGFLPVVRGFRIMRFDRWLIRRAAA